MGGAGFYLLLVAVLLAGVVLLWPRVARRLRHRRAVRDRARFEDAIKHLLACSHRHQAASCDSLAGALGLARPAALALVARMESTGVVKSASGELKLTPEGERWALHVVRAHRLWERYLADEANLPMVQLHDAADRAEHRLTADQLDVLDAHLGHPLTDPHGAPIPSAAGEVEALDATALPDWPTQEPGRIVNIEDEPQVVFNQIVAEGLRPGMVVHVLGRDPDRLIVCDGDTEHRLAPAVAAKIQVAPVAASVARLPADALTLAELPTGCEAEVLSIDERCRGLRRRRLLDLGLTRGARVRPELTGAFGDARAFGVRGTLIALRADQAAQIWVAPTGASEVRSEKREVRREP